MCLSKDAKKRGGGRESCGEWGLQSGAGKVLLGHVSQNGGTSHSGHFGEDTGLGYWDAAGVFGGLGADMYQELRHISHWTHQLAIDVRT